MIGRSNMSERLQRPPKRYFFYPGIAKKKKKKNTTNIQSQLNYNYYNNSI